MCGVCRALAKSEVSLLFWCGCWKPFALQIANIIIKYSYSYSYSYSNDGLNPLEMLDQSQRPQNSQCAQCREIKPDFCDIHPSCDDDNEIYY